ncbi:MAG: acyl-CoA dehydrogenase family protein [Sphingomonadaceae bacterium]|nr:acyl-CoA dehydrogenase family protein [Sphingomonadaceae bacterium]MDW8415627.1 acyl-CoA dehydrogenase family protein [Thermaurantiacus sp.]
MPVVARRAAESEAARRLPADLAATMAEAGLFRLVVPKSLDGHEAHPAVMVETIEAVARGDASAAWCLMIGATTALIAAYLPRHHAEAVLGDRRTITGGVFAPLGRAEREDGGYRVAGRWAWASGSANCAWLVGGAVLHDGGRPEMDAEGRPRHRMMVFQRDQVELIDTWHAAGLRGTGSGDMAVRDQWIPADRTVSLLTDTPREPGPLYRFPAFGLLALGIAAVASGNARAALDEAAEATRARRAPGTGRAVVERATVQAAFAEAEAALHAAQAGLREAVAAAWAEAEAGALRPTTRARLRLQATHLARTAAHAVRMAWDLAGGGALYDSSPLQRRFRDAHAITQHIMVQPATWEATGRILLGLPADLSQI